MIEMETTNVEGKKISKLVPENLVSQYESLGWEIVVKKKEQPLPKTTK